MSLINKIDITKFSDEELKAIGDETKLRLALHAKNENLRQHLWSLVHAVGRLLDDKYSEGDEKVRNQLWQDMHRTGDNAREYLQSDELKDSPYQGSAGTTPEKLQAEAEQVYPYPESSEAWWLAIIDVKRAAHVACAEKYTAIIEDLKQKHEERILILALDMQKKDQEIERLRSQLSLITGELETIEFDPPTAVKRIRNHVTNALKTLTP